ncbi:facilitated trehalose transporter Tret1-like isoform X2 [Periplaneta americana]|uniref:facilitated trehalose transporter Tret1-like isoform X2 n=1 Tax=Periplaneta americana TaxID=6978 RepID=UPI0037E81542
MCEENAEEAKGFISNGGRRLAHLTNVTFRDGETFAFTEETSGQNRHLQPQVMLGMAHLLLVSAIGMSLGHSAVLLPKLKEEEANSNLYVDEETGSLIASIFMLVSPVGSLGGGLLLEHIGRRTSYLLGELLFVLGWLLITTAHNQAMLIGGRVIYGTAVGICTSASSVLYDELSHPRFRGSVLVLGASFGAIGVLAMCTMGAALHWRVAAAFATAPLIFNLLILWFYIPESPTFLVKKNRLVEAELSLTWVWGPDSQAKVMQDLRNLSQRFRTQFEERRPFLNRWNAKACLGRFVNNCKRYLAPPILKPFIIVLVFNILQIPCGLGIVMFYTVDILSKVKGETYDTFDEFTMTILLSTARVISLIISAAAMYRVGRRTIGILSGLGSSAFALAAGVVLYLRHIPNLSVQTEAWINVVLITSYVSLNTFGIYCLAYTMIGEVLPAKVRGELFGSIVAISNVFSGAADKIYPWLLHSLGIHGLFILFGVSSVICTIFVYFFLPETFGCTLDNIEDYFHQPNILWISRNKVSTAPEVMVNNGTLASS